MSHYYECTRELSRRLTEWSKSLDTRTSPKAGDKEERRFVICSGGGPGIMEAATAARANKPTRLEHRALR
jgi:predicted Rossmann-fold nucleotide-binding protein